MSQLNMMRPQMRNIIFDAICSTSSRQRSGNPTEQIADTLSRLASTQETVFSNGTGRSAATGLSGKMERQVERALAEALGRAPGRGAESFINALNSAFPRGADGQLTTTAIRSVVSLTAPVGSDLSSGATSSVGGQLPSEQAALYRQAELIIADGQRILAGLQPTIPTADPEKVEALRAIIRTALNSLLEEFGRIDGPREARVSMLLEALTGCNGTSGVLGELGKEAFQLSARTAIRGDSIQDEIYLANYMLLKSYGATLRQIWIAYQGTARSFTFDLARARQMLPVLAEATTGFVAAMDAVGFTENERRIPCLSVGRAIGNQNNAQLSQQPQAGSQPAAQGIISLSDLCDWLDRFANYEAATILTDSGAYGLKLVGNQADRLFMVIASLLSSGSASPRQASSYQRLVSKILAHERVEWALEDLLLYTKIMADLAV